jgi:hypothetical protein
VRLRQESDTPSTAELVVHAAPQSCEPCLHVEVLCAPAANGEAATDACAISEARRRRCVLPDPNRLLDLTVNSCDLTKTPRKP